MKLKLWRKNLPENWTRKEERELLDQMQSHGVTEILFWDDILKEIIKKSVGQIAVFQLFIMISNYVEKTKRK